jgi:hypothetical protein
MPLYKARLIFITLILFIAGCIEKDELTRPVKVNFKIGISPYFNFNAAYLHITKCQIGIQSIHFEGKREAGEDIFFDTDPKMNLQTLSFLQPITFDVFDIPQGVYNYMEWKISLKCIDTEVLIDDRNEYSPCIGIAISGDYTFLDGYVIPFTFAVNDQVQFNVMSYDPYDNSKLVLSADKEYDANLLFAPEKGFNSFTQKSFEKAEISHEGGYPKIIISSSKNEKLYDLLLNRIFQSAEFVAK